MKTILIYGLKVWLTTSLLGPVLMEIYGLPRSINADIKGVLTVMLFMSALLLPSMALLCLSCWYVNTRITNTVRLKIALTVIGMALTCLTFLILNGGHAFTPGVMAPFCLANAISIWIYRFRPAPVEPVEVLKTNE